jgi:predicted MPP superfamily phosphohydrolase
MLTRRRFLSLSAAASGLGAGTGLYTWRCEPHWLDIVQRPLPIAGLPQPLAGKMLVHLSDLHIGPQVADDYLIRAFDVVRKIAPEIVVYTGDFTSDAPDLSAHTQRMIARLPLGRSGTFGILGNHDYGKNWAQPEVADQIAMLAAAAGVRVLRNEVADIGGLQVVGLDDLWAHRFDLPRAMALMQPDRAALVLSHNPDTADLPGWDSYAGWILAGHTHGGQCKPPFLPPPLLPVANRNYVAGPYQLTGGRQMYINRGLGHLLQVRFNVRPEITVFHLQRAST